MDNEFLSGGYKASLLTAGQAGHDRPGSCSRYTCSHPSILTKQVLPGGHATKDTVSNRHASKDVVGDRLTSKGAASDILAVKDASSDRFASKDAVSDRLAIKDAAARNHLGFKETLRHNIGVTGDVSPEPKETVRVRLGTKDAVLTSLMETSPEGGVLSRPMEKL